MKKYLLLIILIIFMPFIVLGSGTRIMEYDATIINKKGINYEDESGIIKNIPYNSKVRVISEYDDFVELLYSDKKNNKISFTATIDDIIPFDEEVNPHTYKKYDDKENILSKETSSIIVFAKDGLKLRKGPSEKWNEYDDVIDYMTVLNTTYTMYGSMIHNEAENLWFYVESGKYHGWIDTSKIGYKINNTILTFQDVKLKDESNNVITTIPVETIIKEIYRIESKNQFYVKYNFEQGFIDLNYWDEKSKKEVHIFDFGYEITDYVLSKKDIKLISMNGEVRSTIPFGTKIEVLYADYDYSDLGGLLGPRGYFYVKYNNKQGFIKESEVFIDDYSELNDKFISESFTLINNVKLLELSPSTKEITTINKDTIIHTSYCYTDNYSNDDDYYQEEWCIVKYDTNVGRILTKRIKNDILDINNTNQKVDENIIKRELGLENIYIEGYNSFDFNKRNRQYTIKIRNEDKLNIKVLKEIDTDKVEIIGNDNLKNGSIIRIIVKRGDEVTKYFINIQKDSFFKANQYLIYCIIGTIVLAIMSVGFILLINKKKKIKKDKTVEVKKKEEIQEEKIVNEPLNIDVKEKKKTQKKKKECNINAIKVKKVSHNKAKRKQSKVSK